MFIRAATERQRREDAAWRAEARLSEVRTDIAQQMITNPHPGPSANRCDSKNWEKWRDGLKQKLIKASRDRDKVRRALDAGSQRKCERILSQARSSMVEETQRIERLYPIPVPPELVDDLRSFRFPSGPTKHSPLDGPSPPSPQPKLRRYPKMRPPR